MPGLLLPQHANVRIKPEPNGFGFLQPENRMDVVELHVMHALVDETVHVTD